MTQDYCGRTTVLVYYDKATGQYRGCAPDAAAPSDKTGLVTLLCDDQGTPLPLLASTTLSKEDMPEWLCNLFKEVAQLHTRK